MRTGLLVLAALVFSACAHDNYRSDREQREEWRREAQARPPPCPGATWEDGQEYPDGRWEPGRWHCGYPGMQHRRYPAPYGQPGYGGSGYERQDPGDRR